MCSLIGQAYLTKSALSKPVCLSMYNILLETRLLRVKLLFYRKIKSKIDIVTMLFVNTFLCDLFLILFLSVLDMEIAALFFSCAAMFFFHFIQKATNLFRALFYVLIFSITF